MRSKTFQNYPTTFRSGDYLYVGTRTDGDVEAVHFTGDWHIAAATATHEELDFKTEQGFRPTDEYSSASEYVGKGALQREYDDLSDVGDALFFAHRLATMTPLTRVQAEVYAICDVNGLSREIAAWVINRSEATLDDHLAGAHDTIEKAENLRALLKNYA